LGSGGACGGSGAGAEGGDGASRLHAPPSAAVGAGAGELVAGRRLHWPAGGARSVASWLAGATAVAAVAGAGAAIVVVEVETEPRGDSAAVTLAAGDAAGASAAEGAVWKRVRGEAGSEQGRTESSAKPASTAARRHVMPPQGNRRRKVRD